MPSSFAACYIVRMSRLERLALPIALALAALHCALALGYASVTPYLRPGFTNGQLLDDIGAPDEFSHIAYVDHLLRKGEIPVLDPKSEQAKTLYEAHQPPLFYGLDAGWFRLFGTDIRESPGLAARSLNAIFGAGTVLGVFCFGLWLLRKPATALLAAAIAALLPMLCALSGAVSNDPLAINLCTWTLALIVRWRGAWSVWRAMAVGVLIGIAILSKSTGILLIPSFALAIWLSGGARWPALLTGGAGVALIGGPWLIRNQIVYGDPLGLSAFYAYFPRGVWPSQVFSSLRSLARWLYVLLFGMALSAVGIFGYMDIHLRYRYYVPILALTALGFLAAAWRRKSTADAERLDADRAARWPIGLFVVLVVLGFVSYNLWQVQPQARYLFPAIAPFALWVVLGLERVVRRAPTALPLLLLAFLAAANVYALGTLPEEFRKRTDAPEALKAVSPLHRAAYGAPEPARTP